MPIFAVGAPRPFSIEFAMLWFVRPAANAGV